MLPHAPVILSHRISDFSQSRDQVSSSAHATFQRAFRTTQDRVANTIEAILTPSAWWDRKLEDAIQKGRTHEQESQLATPRVLRRLAETG